MKKSELRNILTTEIANELHENWRKSRMQSDGSYTPRWKEVTETDFLAKLDMNNLPKHYRVNDNRKVEIDIANLTYNELNPKYQEENKLAAQVVADIIVKNQKLTKNQIGNIIHDEWLKRNQWAYEYQPELTVPFEKLSLEEQKKDLDQYEIGIKHLFKIFEKTNENIL